MTESKSIYSCGHDPIVVMRDSKLLGVEIWLCVKCKDFEVYQGTDIE